MVRGSVFRRFGRFEVRFSGANWRFGRFEVRFLEVWKVRGSVFSGLTQPLPKSAGIKFIFSNFEPSGERTLNFFECQFFLGN